MSTSYEVQGLKFESLKAIAAHFNVKYTTFLERYKRLGWTLEQALEIKPTNRKPYQTSITVGSRVFDNLNAAARFYNLNVGLVRDRVNKLGWTIEQALGIKPTNRRSHRKSIIIDGKQYKSLNEAAHSLGINIKTLRKRYLEIDMTEVEQVKREGSLNINAKPFKISGIVFPTFLIAYQILADTSDYNSMTNLRRSYHRMRCRTRTVINDISIMQLAKTFNCEVPKTVEQFNTMILDHEKHPYLNRVIDLTEWFTKCHPKLVQILEQDNKE